MKKVIFGLAVAAMAVGVSAFTAMEPDRNENGIPVDYVWYPVTGADEGDCSDAEVDLTLYPTLQYQTISQLPKGPSSDETCGGDDFCCAKGYMPTTGKLVIESIGGETYWVPDSATPDAEEKKNE